MKSYYWLGILSGLAIFLAGLAIALHFSESVVINNVSLILGFIGILATFIVVNNAVQIWKIEVKVDKIEENLKNIDNSRKKMINASKRTILTPVYMLYKKDDNNEPNKAFLFLLDIIPIMGDLYGAEGYQEDEDRETLTSMVGLFRTIMSMEDKYGTKIEKKSFERCLQFFNKYLPPCYHKIDAVKELEEEIQNKIKQLQYI